MHPRKLLPALLAGALAFAGLAAAPAGTPAGDRLLPEPANGRAALDGLGDRLPEAAQRNGISVAELRADVLADADLWVDERGHLRFMDTRTEVTDADSVPTTSEPVDTSITFQLESLPGAQRTVFLDFDGFDARGTFWDDGWSGVNAPGYDSDGDPSTFSAAEHAVIHEVWARVAEDFAPFAVNVTTRWPGLAALERTSLSDQQYGTVAAISSTDDRACSCGGVAYLRTFDSTDNSRFWPAWTFARGVGNTNASNIAEATSHEIGHNLGLSHDGDAGSGYHTGSDGWAPIMGVGYYQPITLWSDGSYAGANNTEDDFVVAQANGAPLRADDHGDTAATATFLDTSSGTGTLRGVVATRDDVDAVTVDVGAGTTTFTVDAAHEGANLDVQLQLLDAGGGLVATADPTSARLNNDDSTGMDASLQLLLAAGRYTLLIDGVGRGVYDDYGSLGHWELTVEAAAGTPGSAPVAVASPTSITGVGTTTVTLDGSGSTDADDDIVSYRWSFGDGSQDATGDVVQHTYAAGSHTATLTVTDATGRTGTATVSIQLDEPTPEPPATPAAPSATVATDGGVTLVWPSTEGATGYTVTRESQHRNGRWNQTTTLGPVSVPTLADAPGSGTFRYRVTASNDDGTATGAWTVVDVTTSGGGDGGDTGGGGGGKGGGKGGPKVR